VTISQLENNPLLHFSGLPKFNEVKAEHVSPAVDYLLADARTTVEALAKADGMVTWDNFASKLEDMEERLSRAWSQVGHINAVVNSPELREAYNDNLSKLTDFYADLGQDERLYAKFHTLRNSAAFEALTIAQKKIVENELLDFV
jgi:oligopeptidase A